MTTSPTETIVLRPSPPTDLQGYQELAALLDAQAIAHDEAAKIDEAANNTLGAQGWRGSAKWLREVAQAIRTLCTRSEKAEARVVELEKALKQISEDGWHWGVGPTHGQRVPTMAGQIARAALIQTKD